MHAAFGKGLVLSVVKMGGDALLEVAFDDIGTKAYGKNCQRSHEKAVIASNT